MKRVFVISMQDEDKAELGVHDVLKDELLAELTEEARNGEAATFIESIPSDGLSAEEWPENGILIIEGVIRVPQPKQVITELEFD